MNDQQRLALRSELIDDLYAQLGAVGQENAALRQENAQLRAQLAAQGPPAEQNQPEPHEDDE